MKVDDAGLRRSFADWVPDHGRHQSCLPSAGGGRGCDENHGSLHDLVSIFVGTLNQTSSSVHVGTFGRLSSAGKLTATTHSIALARLLQVLVCSIDLWDWVSLIDS